MSNVLLGILLSVVICAVIALAVAYTVGIAVMFQSHPIFTLLFVTSIMNLFTRKCA